MGRSLAPHLLPGLASLVVPGLGQLVQQRWVRAALQFGLAVSFYFLWIPLIGPVVHLWSIVDAATYIP